MGTVLTDQRPEQSDGDGVIVVGRFKGGPYDGVQLSYVAGQRNLYLTPRRRCAWQSCSRRQPKRQAHRINGYVPLAAVHLLGVIPAPAGPGHGIGGAHRLGIDHRRGRLRVTPGGGPGPGPQHIVQPGQGAIVAPGREVPVHRQPGRTGAARPARANRPAPASGCHRSAGVWSISADDLASSASAATAPAHRPLRVTPVEPPVTARVATRSPDNWSSWSKNHLPETSLLIDERHTSTGRLPRILLNTA